MRKTARETLQELDLRIASLEKEALFGLFESPLEKIRAGERDLKGSNLKGADLTGMVLSRHDLLTRRVRARIIRDEDGSTIAIGR
jgi:uncharacterized protein YjbI with pentapeptide repeats